MAQLNVTIVYNSGTAQSLAAAMVLKTRYAAEAVTMLDALGLTEALMDTLIDTVTDATQDRIYVTTVVDASYAALGQLSTDVNIVTLDAKLKATAVAPYNASIELGEVSGTNQPVLRAWKSVYPNASWPLLVRYMSGTYFPIKAATADSVGNTTLTDAGNFTASAHIGHYVGIVSSTLGAGQIRRITSNTANALTVPAWSPNPTGTIVYQVAATEAEIFRLQALNSYILGNLYDLTSSAVVNKWYRLLDFGTYDSSYNTLASGALVAPFTDSELLEEIIATGKDEFYATTRALLVVVKNTP